jgi:outer membrane protein assembly factor BamB
MTRLAFLLALACSALALSHSPAADWSRFRGPNGSGVADGPLPPIDPKNPLWKTPIPGKGVSSPIVVGGKVYLQTGAKDGKTRTLLCLDVSSGKTLWTKDVPGEPAKPKGLHNKNSLASSTPASEGKQLYCVWWDGSAVSLHAYDLDGNEKWRASLGGYQSQHGPGMSPVVHNGKVFVNVDDDEHAELVAFDAATGEKKWVAGRKKERACYSSPYILKRDGKPEELLLGTTHAITSYDPATGKVNWEHKVAWGQGQAALRVIGHPVYAGGRLVMSFGDGKGDRIVIGVDPEKPAAARAWELSKGSYPYVPCMLVKDDLIYFAGDQPTGSAGCLDPKTGKVLFNESVTTKPPSASPVLVGDEILMVADDGEIVVFKAAREFESVLKVKLGEVVYASPAVADGKVFIRGATHLYCFGKK